MTTKENRPTFKIEKHGGIPGLDFTKETQNWKEEEEEEPVEKKKSKWLKAERKRPTRESNNITIKPTDPNCLNSKLTTVFHPLLIQIFGLLTV